MSREFPYFKLYTEARTDAKLATLTDAQFRVWFKLLCYAADQPVRGTVAQPEYLVAIETTGGDARLLRETCEALVRLQILDFEPARNDVTPCHAPPVFYARFLRFEERQKRKPSDAPEATRERKARSRHKRTSRSVTRGHAPVTPGHAACHAIREEGEKKSSPLRSEDLDSLRSSRERDAGAAPRDPADRALVTEAVSLLTSDLRSESVGLHLLRNHDTATLRAVPGWKLLRAAKILAGPNTTDDQRRSWPYFAGIATRMGDDQRDAPLPWEPRRKASRAVAHSEALAAQFRRAAEEQEARDGTA